MRQLDQDQQRASALDQGAHCAGIAFALDEVALPVAWKLVILHLGRKQVDAEHIGDLATPVLALTAWRRQAISSLQSSPTGWA